MKIYIASDHAGYELKEKIIEYLVGLGKHEVADKGPFEYNEDDDYPDFIAKVAKEVSEDSENSVGIVLGGSGQGEAMVADKFKNVRAAVFYGGDLEIVKLAREHNNSNILSLGARFLDEEMAINAVKLWLETPFSNEKRHVRRIDKIKDIFKKNRKD